jgi:hypothetical protein
MWVRLLSSSARAFAIAAPATVLVLGGGRRGDADPPAPQEEARPSQGAESFVAARAAKVREQRQETGSIYPFGLSGTELNGANLIAGRDTKQVTITASVPTSRLSELVLQASGPLSEGDPRSTVVQLDGLANKGKVGAEWRYGQQRLPSSAEMKELTEKLVRRCARATAAPEPDAATGLEVQGCSLADLERDDEAAALVSRLFPRRTAWYLSIKGHVGTETFSYSDSVTLQGAKSRKWSTSGAVVLGVLTAGNVYVAASGRIDRTFEGADKQAVCPASEAGASVVCPLAVVGGPKEKTLRVTEFEARKYLPRIGGLTIGAAVILRRDWKAEMTTAEIPLYFVRDKDGGLSGGLSAGYVWSSDTQARGARFTVFVGQRFNLGGG